MNKPDDTSPDSLDRRHMLVVVALGLGVLVVAAIVFGTYMAAHLFRPEVEPSEEVIREAVQPTPDGGHDG